MRYPRVAPELLPTSRRVFKEASAILASTSDDFDSALHVFQGYKNLFATAASSLTVITGFHPAQSIPGDLPLLRRSKHARARSGEATDVLRPLRTLTDSPISSDGQLTRTRPRTKSMSRRLSMPAPPMTALASTNPRRVFTLSDGRSVDAFERLATAVDMLRGQFLSRSKEVHGISSRQGELQHIVDALSAKAKLLVEPAGQQNATVSLVPNGLSK